MHPISFPRCLGWSLLLLLGLHVAASRTLAQPPPAAGGDDDKNRIIRVPLDQPALVTTTTGEKIKEATIDNPKIALVQTLKDNPFIVRVIGLTPGRTALILVPEKGPMEIKTVLVLDTEEELFQVERRKLEKRKDILLAMIRQTVPTANVDVIVGLQRNRVAVGGGFGAQVASGPNDNTVLTGTVILTGIVFEVEKINIIMDMTNAIFAGVATNTAPGTGGQAPSAAPVAGGISGTPPTGGGQQQSAGGTIIGPQGTGGGNLGNRVVVINNLRLAGVQQVELGVVMAVVNRSEARAMGFNWFNNHTGWFLTSFVNPAVGVGQGLTAAAAAASAFGGGGGGTSGITTPPQFGFGVLNNNNGFSGFLQALRTENLVKILAEPRLLTLSGRPANFVDGGQIPVITSSTGGSTTSYLQFGTVVNFVPIVLGNGKIHLEVAASISSPNSAVGVSISTAGSLASAPGLTTRGAQVAVQLEDGQTLAIGGLIQNTVNGQTSKVPILGDLPYFGVAFRAVTYTETEEELLILVTPRLVDPMACTQLKLPPSRETRSADDYELFLEGILEAPRGRRDVFPDHHYAAAHTGPGANQIPFPCGNVPRDRFQGGYGNCATGNCPTGGCSTSNYYSPSPSYGATPPIGVPQNLSVDRQLSAPAEPVADLPAGFGVMPSSNSSMPAYVPPQGSSMPAYVPPQGNYAQPAGGMSSSPMIGSPQGSPQYLDDGSRMTLPSGPNVPPPSFGQPAPIQYR